MCLIKINNLQKIYGSGDAQTIALKNISLTISSGEMIAIMGKSGSGKSTLLNIIGCLDKQNSGEYFLNGINVLDINANKLAHLRREFIGFVVQNFALIENYTVYENIKIPLDYGKVSNKEKKARISNILKKLEIEDKINKYPSELSGGQNQRVAIARALINNPKIILADEPTGALDKLTAQKVLNILKQLNKEGFTVVIVTHDENVAKACNRVINIEDGVILDN